MTEPTSKSLKGGTHSLALFHELTQGRTIPEVKFITEGVRGELSFTDGLEYEVIVRPIHRDHVPETSTGTKE